MPTKNTGKKQPKKNRKSEVNVHKTKRKIDKSKKQPGSGKKLSYGDYHAVFMAYLEEQSISAVVKQTGLSKSTVERYVKRGDPKRKLLPIHDHVSEIFEKAQEKTVMTFADAQSDIIQMAGEYRKKLFEKIKSLEPSEISLHSIGNELEKLARLETFVRGWKKVNSRSDESPDFSSMSDEELDCFFDTGLFPDEAERLEGGTQGVIDELMNRQSSSEA